MRNQATTLRKPAPEAPQGARMPLYMGLARRLNEGLQRGHWGAADAMPSERVLAEVLAVSRETARKALSLLCKRGLLVRVRGSGTYRAAPAQAAALGGAAGYRLQRACAVAATAAQAAQMGVAPGTALLHVQILRSAPSGPALEVERSWLLGPEAGLCLELHLAPS
jgi:GntR family transcriptional regulator